MRIVSAGADAVPLCHNLAVDTDVFWDVIGAARERSGTDIPFHRALADCLVERGEQDIFGFKVRFDEVHDALYRWDVWAAAYLIGGGCSDDSFIDFRYGLIAQGRDWYEKVAASPDSLADHPAAHAGPYSAEYHGLFYEQAGYAVARAYTALTGSSTPAFYAALRASGAPRSRGIADGPDGEDFDFDDPREMRRRLPRLTAVCLGNGPDEPPRRRLLA
jgi:Protein of unknown function (DUF4240)